VTVGRTASPASWPTSTEMPRYFAYGSNLDLEDLARWAQRAGCGPPDLRFEARAWLPDHALRFHYRSPARGGGALDVTPRLGAAVSGALFVTGGFELLDRKEGVAEGRYERFRCRVIREDGALAQAVSYRVRAAHRRPHHVPPTEAYLATVRRGMRRWGLSEEGLERAARDSSAVSWPSQIFVYGTLMRGHCRAAVMEQAGPRGVLPATVRGRLVDLGAYPGLVPGEGLVHGELWRYDDVASLLAELDAIEDFEGYQRLPESLYVRTIVAVDVDGVPAAAWTYLWQGPAAPSVPAGRWTGA